MTDEEIQSEAQQRVDHIEDPRGECRRRFPHFRFVVHRNRREFDGVIYTHVEAYWSDGGDSSLRMPLAQHATRGQVESAKVAIARSALLSHELRRLHANRHRHDITHEATR